MKPDLDHGLLILIGLSLIGVAVVSWMHDHQRRIEMVERHAEALCEQGLRSDVEDLLHDHGVYDDDLVLEIVELHETVCCIDRE